MHILIPLSRRVCFVDEFRELETVNTRELSNVVPSSITCLSLTPLSRPLGAVRFLSTSFRMPPAEAGAKIPVSLALGTDAAERTSIQGPRVASALSWR